MSAALVTSDKENLKLNRFYVWFATAVCRWLDIALYKAMIRIGKAIALDSLQPIDSLVKFSSSAVDTVTVFYQVTLRFPRQPSPRCRLRRDYSVFMIIFPFPHFPIKIKTFWEQLAWPDTEGALTFVIKIIDVSRNQLDN